ncbi:hypothetical protein [Pseudomonas sp. SID14000]|uniref:hypothetical protein n=1 Tax=Pseudomonas sp. SID14000 TaxID=1986221 RepID=UPI0011240BED|nr:hypothetical protein [Pseudomonas sp. SID14000]
MSHSSGSASDQELSIIFLVVLWILLWIYCWATRNDYLNHWGYLGIRPSKPITWWPKTVIHYVSFGLAIGLLILGVIASIYTLVNSSW